MAAKHSTRSRSLATPSGGPLERLLDPIDLLSETIYSVLVLLSFTLAFRIFKLGGDPTQAVSAEYVNELLIASIEAILVWGLIDGVMHILLELFQRSERHRLLKQIQAAESEQAGVAAIAEELDHVLEPIAENDERLALYRRVYSQLRTGKPRPIGIKREDILGAFVSLLVAFLAVLPSLVPFFLLRHDYALAIRVSNIVSFAVLFAAGYSWGKYTDANPWTTGLLLMGVGALMVAIAIPFGG